MNQRRGLGRGLGALIPSSTQPRPAPAAAAGERAGRVAAAAEGGRRRTTAPPRRRARRDDGGLVPVAGADFAELPARADHAQPAPAAPGLRRGGDGRAGALDPRDRAAPADRRPAGRARTATSCHGRAALAGPQAGRARARSRRSCARPTTTTCCATRCWRTCTAPSSTRWRRRPPTSSCSTTSAAPTRSWPAGSAAAARRSATPCGCSGSPAPVQRRVAAGVLSAGHARALLGARRPRGHGPAGHPGRRRGSVGPVGGGARRRRSGRRPAAHPHARGRAARPRPGLVDLADRLSDRLETRVKVETSASAKGKVTIEFATLDDLRRIVDLIDRP